MRIFLSCLQSPVRHPIPAYGFWEPYFKRGIEEGGHSWVETPGADWAEGLVYATGLVSTRDPRLDAWRERTWSATLEHLRREHEREPVDFFLGYLYAQQVEPAAIDSIRALGIPCVNFFCDNVREFRTVPSQYAAFDLHWVPEDKALPLYKRAGYPTVHAPMPTWVDPAHRTCAHEERYKPTFIGSRDSQREALFARVLELGGDVELRGPGWDGAVAAPATRSGSRGVGEILRHQVDFARSQGPAALARKIGTRFRGRRVPISFAGHVAGAVFGAEYVAVTQQSTVTLGVNRFPSFRFAETRPDTYSRLRDIEAPMLGACYLTEWTEGLDSMYELGSEIETYRDAGEMVEKLAMLQRDPRRRAMMRCKAQRRALADHSVARSISRVAERLGVRSR